MHVAGQVQSAFVETLKRIPQLGGAVRADDGRVPSENVERFALIGKGVERNRAYGPGNRRPKLLQRSLPIYVSLVAAVTNDMDPIRFEDELRAAVEIAVAESPELAKISPDWILAEAEWFQGVRPGRPEVAAVLEYDVTTYTDENNPGKPRLNI